METRSAAVAAMGLTTTQSPFIEQARRNGELYISQPYELYTPENHAAWTQRGKALQGF